MWSKEIITLKILRQSWFLAQQQQQKQACGEIISASSLKYTSRLEHKLIVEPTEATRNKQAITSERDANDIDPYSHQFPICIPILCRQIIQILLVQLGRVGVRTIAVCRHDMAISFVRQIGRASCRERV